MDIELADDLIIGAKPIAAWLGQPERRIFHMAKTNRLPLFKIGNQWAGRKSTIAAHIAGLEAKTKAD